MSSSALRGRRRTSTSRRVRSAVLAAAIAVAAVAASAVGATLPAAPAAAATVAKSTVGTDFWTTFEPNVQSADLSLTISSATGTSGTVSWPDGTSSPFTTTAGTTTSVPAPQSLRDAIQASATDATVEWGVHIIAAAPVSVYGINLVPYTSDAFVAIPTNALTDRYRVLSYSTTIDSYPSRLQVVATQDGTTVTVTPKQALGARAAGVPFQVSLDQGQVYTLAGTAFGADVTGTLIESSAPVAVSSGVDCGNVGGGACDLLGQQMYGTSQWGQDFVLPRFASQSADDIVRVLADQDGTVVSRDGTEVATLAAGEFWEGTLGQTSGNAAAHITASAPVAVAQFLTSNAYGPSSVTGDPAMLLVPPTEQFLSAYTVATPATGFSWNAINVVVPTTATGSFRLDGAAVDASAFAAVDGTTYSTAQLEVAVGAHTLTADAPFGAFSYGANDYDAYAYAGGAALSPVASIAAVALDGTPTSNGVIGEQACFPVTVTDSNGDAVEGVRVDLAVTGANDGSIADSLTGADGTASVCYTPTNAGEDTVTLTAGGASTTAKTTVTAAPVATAPVITSHPVSTSVDEGATASFSVEATGDPAPTFAWERSDDEGATWTAADDTDADGDVTAAAVADSATYTIRAAKADDGAQFRAVVTNAAGTVRSDAATLSVTAVALPDPSATPTAGPTAHPSGTPSSAAAPTTDPSDGSLAYTGSDALRWAGLAAVLLLAGAALLVWKRRRRA
ncbi:LPXTG-motif cell wall-anchored protein [Curtobacterium pusillum]|uniref:LPXTG-motif cell wall-anchored protein n=1 Tax=Curtobacterium pusillum TaxID=69373 RepID=A0AAW3T6J3_9MICO|nr:LPXTG-motif cell wall-anchored protein [Curtobacterium pusillum]